MIIETTAADYAALLRGHAPRDLTLADTPIAPPEVLQMLADVARSVRVTFSPAAWLIVEAGELVGMCSVTCPPDGGCIDIGYGIAPSRRRRGIATRAIAAVVEWAAAAPHVTAITADTLPGNRASQRVLEANGFTRTGERVDPEDGRLLCWRRAVA